ncbi:hypothetical protein Efla_003260 [Eimeria flavescens]
MRTLPMSFPGDLEVLTIKIAAAAAEFKSLFLSCSLFTGRIFFADCIYPSGVPAAIHSRYARVLSPGRQLRRFVEVPAPEEGFSERLGNTRGRTTGNAEQPSSQGLQPTPTARSPTSGYAEYEQSSSSSEDDQPSSPQQQVQGTIPNRLIRTWRPREDNLDSREQVPFGATEVPRVQCSPSPGVSADEGPPSSAESSAQESADKEPPAAPPASGGGAGDGS